MENQGTTKLDQINQKPSPQFNLILKAMGEEFGYIATHAILSHMSKTSLKPISEIISNYETFCRILKLVYTAGVAEKEVLGRLSKYKLYENAV